MNVRQLKNRLKSIGGKGQGVEPKRISNITGLSQRTIHRYLDPNDPAVPSLGFMQAVCRHYAVSMDQIVLGGGRISDPDIEHKWQVFVSWWSANLSQDDKASIMQAAESVWAKALTMAATNKNLNDEVLGHLAHKISPQRPAKHTNY